MNVPYGDVDRIVKFIPEGPGVKLRQALPQARAGIKTGYDGTAHKADHRPGAPPRRAVGAGIPSMQ